MDWLVEAEMGEMEEMIWDRNVEVGLEGGRWKWKCVTR